MTLSPVLDFEALRAREFARLDAQGITYLDFAAGALYGASQVEAYTARLRDGIYGNPHSEHAPSRASHRDLETARAVTLDFFDADPAVYDVVFTANTSAAVKLVAESYPFSPGRGLVLSADNHNSINGIREYARSKDAPVHVLPLDADLRLEAPTDRLAISAQRMGAGLLAFPLQSNFSGVKHDPGLVRAAQDLGFDVLLDAAGCGAVCDLSLRAYPAQFLAFSFYKLFGLPTGMGALIARRDALARLRRPWFAGGTVDFVSIAHDRHQLSRGHQGLEDGTPNYLDAGAVESGFRFLAQIDQKALAARLQTLTETFLRRAGDLRHDNGAPRVRIYGPADMTARGGTVAFNLLTREGALIPFADVESRGHARGIALRGGCFCNPGAAESAFGLQHLGAARCLDELRDRFSLAAFQACLGSGQAVGALRLSVGLPTTFYDLDRALALIASFV